MYSLIDSVEIWPVELRAATASAAEWETLLDQVERIRLREFRNRGDRFRYLLAHGAVRTILGGYLQQDPARLTFDRTCPTCPKPHGKPRLAAPGHQGVEFSLSHSGDMVVVAVTIGRVVGVDVEAERRMSDHMDGATFAAQEVEILDTLDDSVRDRIRLKAWTRKEAVVKATGEGVNRNLSEVMVLGPGGACALGGGLKGLCLADLDLGPGYVGAVAYSGPPTDLVTRTDWIDSRPSD